LFSGQKQQEPRYSSDQQGMVKVQKRITAGAGTKNIPDDLIKTLLFYWSNCLN